MSPAPQAVAVTGASGQVGTLLCERLGERGVRVIPLGRGDDWRAGIAGADAVVHLAGTLQPRRGESYEAANVAPAQEVARAARAGGCGRIVFLSYVGASLRSRNAYLRAKATAEHKLQGSGLPTTIFRCLHIYGPPERPGPTAGPFLAEDSKAVTVPGTGRQRIQPLYIGDVVAAVAAAATGEQATSGTFELGGPEEISMDEFVRALNGGAEVKIRHLPAPVARLAARLSPSLTPALMELLLTDNVTTAPVAEIAERFDFTPHRLAEVWPPARAR
ncbi:MAG TPA: NAD-dependent epimerase/dehydratase family protein [Solirubrobacterales bacterium]|nr:NAD-dependent epimerase/dehydratase family protein [Solirubrobacterales bacterium]